MKSRNKPERKAKKTSKLIMKKVEKEKPMVKAIRKSGGKMTVKDYV